MFNCDGIAYHLRRHRVKYLIAGIMFVFLLLGIILTAVGSHEQNTLMAAIGILILISNGIWMIGYACKLCCCPDANTCCEEPTWETYETV